MVDTTTSGWATTSAPEDLRARPDAASLEQSCAGDQDDGGGAPHADLPAQADGCASATARCKLPLSWEGSSRLVLALTQRNLEYTLMATTPEGRVKDQGPQDPCASTTACIPTGRCRADTERPTSTVWGVTEEGSFRSRRRRRQRSRRCVRRRTDSPSTRRWARRSLSSA